MAKRSLCLLLAVAVLFSLAVPALAEGEPAPAEEPVVTEEVVETEAPVVTEEVLETEAPVITEEVVETEAPVVTEEVVETEVPAPVEAPTEVPEAPVPVEVPVEVTEEPAEVPAAPEAETLQEPQTVDEPMPAAAVTDSGNCGPLVNDVPSDSVKWSLSGSTLTISGTGPMADLTTNMNIPYKDYLFDITKVDIKDGVTRIGNNAFCGCTFLTDVTIPTSVTSIGAYAFECCTYLPGIDIPNSVKSIGRTAFLGCTGLTDVTIPDSVTTIDNEAFRDCSNLKYITFSANLTSVGGTAFDGTPWLADQGDFVVMGGWLYRYQGTAATATVPDTVKKLSGISSFSTKTLKELIVPKTVTYIGGFCFNECPNLKSVTVYNAKAEFGQLYDPSCPTAPRTLELASYSTSTAHTWVVSFGNRDHLTFKDLGPDPDAPAPTASPVPPTPTPTATPRPTPTPRPVKPAQPYVSTVANVAGGVTIAWNAVSNATSYRAYYRTGSGVWKTLADTSETSYTWTKAKSGTKYSFSVSASNAAGSTSYSRTGKSITYMAQPKVKSAKIDASGVKITWAKVKGAAKYQVMYKVGDGKWKVLAKSATGTSYTWKKAKSGTNYTFSVRAVAKDGSTGAYNETGKSLTYIAAPKVKSAKKVSGGIKITWAKVNGAAKYQVMYKVGNGKWKQLTTTTKRTFTWKKAKNGTKYTFSVRAVTADGTKGVYNTTGKSLTYKK